MAAYRRRRCAIALNFVPRGTRPLGADPKGRLAVEQLAAAPLSRHSARGWCAEPPRTDALGGAAPSARGTGPWLSQGLLRLLQELATTSLTLGAPSAILR